MEPTRVKPAAIDSPPLEEAIEPLTPMHLRAFTLDDQRQVMRFLPSALSASGAWLLGHQATAGVLRFLFEFERSNGIHVYGMLVSLGLELTPSSHLAFIDFCQRTHNLPSAETMKASSCELEIRELLEEEPASDACFGAPSMA